MPEVWLRNNSRALWFAMVLPAVLGTFGLLLLLGVGQEQVQLWVRIVGGILAGVGLTTVLLVMLQLRQPRVAYRYDSLLLYLRGSKPISVPIEIVEGFLIGQAPSLLPGRQYKDAETATLMIRLAESAEEWSQVSVKPALGKWCASYITIRGTWCEPLSTDLVNRLNQRLSEVQAEFRAHEKASRSFVSDGRSW